MHGQRRPHRGGVTLEHARLRVGGGGGDGTVDAARMLAFWKAAVMLYPDGTPRTKHVITNPIIEVDDHTGTASCRWGTSRLRGTTTR